MVKIAIVIAVLIASILILAATKPTSFHIQRSIDIDAPPDQVFPLINDLHNWPRWGKEDLRVRRTYSGPENGQGAISEWSGSGKEGKGRMLITESLPTRKVSVQVDWAKPFVARNINEFTFERVGNSTRVTWTMNGPNLYAMRLMGIFVNMDRNMGKHFEAGLANLKEFVEHESR